MESGLHAIRDCSFSRMVWLFVVPEYDHGMFFSKSHVDWLYYNLKSTTRWGIENLKWQSLYSILCWLLRKDHNLYVFADGHSSVQKIVDTGIARELYKYEFNFALTGSVGIGCLVVTSSEWLG